MKQNSPKVSIIIPNFNNAKFLPETIQSALNQSWPNKEIIIVDDGSTDNSLLVAKSFESDIVKVIAQSNGGSCRARNKGFSESLGDYIQYLDSDDIIEGNKIEKQMELLSNFERGYISSCSWGFFTESTSDTIFNKQLVWADMPPVDWLVAAWSGGGMMQTACWLTPRNIIEKAGPWNEELKRNPNDDGEFFCRVMLNSKGIKFQPESKVYYRKHIGYRVSTNASKDAITSLLGTCYSYEASIFKAENSERTRIVVERNYASFIYQYYDSFRDLTDLAHKRLLKLGVKKIKPTGGKNFAFLASVFGFINALKVRSLLRRIACIH